MALGLSEDEYSEISESDSGDEFLDLIVLLLFENFEVSFESFTDLLSVIVGEWWSLCLNDSLLILDLFSIVYFNVLECLSYVLEGLSCALLSSCEYLSGEGEECYLWEYW